MTRRRRPGAKQFPSLIRNKSAKKSYHFFPMIDPCRQMASSFQLLTADLALAPAFTVFRVAKRNGSRPGDSIHSARCELAYC